jgi:hypothetical protein
MSSQHFYGPVEQVAGTTIVNQYDRETIEERRRVLIERQMEHVRLRDAADHRTRRHPCRWVPPLAFFAVGATAFYEFHHFSAASWLWPIQFGLLAIGGSTLLVYEHIRRDCRSVWAQHNQAVAEINRVLYTL